MRNSTLFTSLLTLALIALTADAAGELVRLVRLKLSAGDLASAVSAVEDYKEKHGVDAEYLDAMGWLARGAEMLSLIGKLAALYADGIRDSVVIEAVNDIENLTTGLGRKIWQKITIIGALAESRA